jgi:hypothetical protein
MIGRSAPAYYKNLSHRYLEIIKLISFFSGEINVLLFPSQILNESKRVSSAVSSGTDDCHSGVSRDL